MDADGYLGFQGRIDDVFEAAGCRIGTSEIKNCLVKHPSMANAALVPKPAAERGAVVKAHMVLAAGVPACARLFLPAPLATRVAKRPRLASHCALRPLSHLPCKPYPWADPACKSLPSAWAP